VVDSWEFDVRQSAQFESSNFERSVLRAAKLLIDDSSGVWRLPGMAKGLGLDINEPHDLRRLVAG